MVKGIHSKFDTSEKKIHASVSTVGEKYWKKVSRHRVKERESGVESEKERERERERQ